VTDAAISVVVAARDAEATIEQTLDSLQAQSYADWEAVVVDDASTDATAAVVRGRAGRDERIRIVSGAGEGAGAARNVGASLARGSYLLSLDADDWLLPGALAALVEPLRRDQSLAGAYCTWRRVTDDGVTISETSPAPDEALFAQFARTCPFSIHSCLLRRVIFEHHGGFDPDLRTCEDWDLWQRITRTGAAFARVDGVHAVYRVTAGSLTLADDQVVRDGLRVVARGHAADPRVPDPAPAYAHGMPPTQLRSALLHVACWGAGLALGDGRSGADVLAHVREHLDVTFSPHVAAEGLYWGVPVGASRPLASWPELWDRRRGEVEGLLGEIEALTGSPRLRARVLRLLEGRILAAAGSGVRVGAMEKRRIELTAPIEAIEGDSARVLLEATVEGEVLGVIELPVCDGAILARVVADAAAAAFGWRVLEAFFDRNGSRGDDTWLTFLQELWERRDWTLEQFYTPSDLARGGGTEPAAGAAFEVSDDLRPLTLAGSTDLRLTIAGHDLGVLRVDRRGVAEEGEVVAAVTEAVGAELATAAAREALLGRPLDEEPATLRARLRQAAQVEPPNPRRRTLVLARREPRELGGARSRIAGLPSAAAADLRRSARAHSEGVLARPFRPGAVVYAGDMLDGAAPVGPATVPPAREEADGFESLPILMYHRVSADTSDAAARFCVHPELFELQLRHLRGEGYRSVRLDEWSRAVGARRPLGGRAVAITFDDGYVDFAAEAWPLLRQYGFGATLFVVTEAVGRFNDWERGALGERRPLLDWRELRRLESEGLAVGAHSATHEPLTALSHGEVAREAARSRTALRTHLERPVGAFSYPYGDVNPSVSTLVGACGFTFGLTTRPGRATWRDGLLELPRIEARGDEDLDAFASELEPAATTVPDDLRPLFPAAS
jgi:peptidoglycan/xylan/chitin deacetylase (PgdA/CDA1 family)